MRNRASQPGNRLVYLRGRRVEFHHEGTDLRAQEMVRTACPETGQRFHIVGAHKIQNGVAVIEMPDHMLVAADHAANDRHQSGGGLPSVQRQQGGAFCAAECAVTECLLLEPVDGLVDCVYRDFVAGSGIVCPCEQAVTLQNYTFCAGVLQTEFFKPQAQFVTGAFPGQPADVVAENIGGHGLAVSGCRDRNDRVRVHVVDMGGGYVGREADVSMEAARGLRLKVQCGRYATISSSYSTPR